MRSNDKRPSGDPVHVRGEASVRIALQPDTFNT